MEKEDQGEGETRGLYHEAAARLGLSLDVCLVCHRNEARISCRKCGKPYCSFYCRDFDWKTIPVEGDGLIKKALGHRIVCQHLVGKELSDESLRRLLASPPPEKKRPLPPSPPDALLCEEEEEEEAGAQKQAGPDEKPPAASSSSEAAAAPSAATTTPEEPSQVAQVNKANKDGETLAHIATKMGLTSKLKDLIRSGCDVNAPNKHGQTPAFIAACYGQTEALEVLIRANCDVNQVLSSTEVETVTKGP